MPGRSAVSFLRWRRGVLPTLPIRSCAAGGANTAVIVLPGHKRGSCTHNSSACTPCALPHSGLISILQLVILQDPVLIRRLLIRPGAIGDFIVSLPALETLRADYTEIWCAEANIPLAFCADRVRSIISAGLDRLGLLPAEDVIERLRGFDSIVSWYGSNRPEFRELTGSLGLPFTFLTALPKGGLVHAVEFYNAQAFEITRRRGSRFPRI